MPEITFEGEYSIDLGNQPLRLFFAGRAETDDATATKDTPKKTVSKNDLLPPPERLHKRYKNILANWHKFEEHEVLELYLSAMCSSFDPHSSYMSPRTVVVVPLAL